MGGGGEATSGFAVFLYDLGPLAIAEVGGGLIQKEGVGFKAAKFSICQTQLGPFSACGPGTYSSRDYKSPTNIVHGADKAH